MLEQAASDVLKVADTSEVSNEELFAGITEAFDTNASIHTYEQLESRVNDLMFKYKAAIAPIGSEYNLKDIKSPGYRRILEILNIISHLQSSMIRSKPFNILCTLEITELSFLLSQLTMIYIKEGIDANSFDSASSFIEPFLTTNTLLSLTQKKRDKSRKKWEAKRNEAFVKDSTKQASSGITKNNRWQRRDRVQNYNPNNNNVPRQTQNKQPFQRKFNQGGYSNNNSTANNNNNNNNSNNNNFNNNNM